MFRGNRSEKHHSWLSGALNPVAWFSMTLLLVSAAFLVAAAMCEKRGLFTCHLTVTGTKSEARVGWHGVHWNAPFMEKDFWTWKDLDFLNNAEEVADFSRFYMITAATGAAVAVALAGIIALHIIIGAYYRFTKATLWSFALAFVCVFGASIVLVHVYLHKLEEELERKSERGLDANILGVEIDVDITTQRFKVDSMPDWGMALSYAAWFFFLMLVCCAPMLPDKDRRVYEQGVTMERKENAEGVPAAQPAPSAPVV